MKSTKKVLCAALALLLFATPLTACSASEPSQPAIPPEEETVQPAPVEEPLPSEPAEEEEPEEEPVQQPEGPVNPLTGLMDGLSEEAASRKPAAVMINNLKQSLPQLGISQADIIYEMMAEGRIYRMLAVFQDPARVGRIGSVRSARPYFVDMAENHNAVFFHIGASVPGYEALRSRKNVLSFDGIYDAKAEIFYRDAERKKKNGYEHSVLTTGEQIAAVYAKQDPEKISNADAAPAFAFSAEHSALNGQNASRIDVPYSNYIKVWFEYDTESGTYKRFQYDEPHMDAEYDVQLAFGNVFVLFMKARDVPGSDLHLVEITTTGSGTGYYACGGKAVEINWSKKDHASPMVYTLADGSPLKVAPGKSFICCAPTTTDVAIS